MKDEEREDKEEKKTDPHIDGKRKDRSDILVGVYWSIGLMIPFTPFIFIGVFILGFSILGSSSDSWFLVITVIIYISILIGLSLIYIKKNRRNVTHGIIIANLIYFLIWLVLYIIIS